MQVARARGFVFSLSCLLESKLGVMVQSLSEVLTVTRDMRRRNQNLCLVSQVHRSQGIVAAAMSGPGAKKAPIWPGSPFRGVSTPQAATPTLAEKYYREVVVKEPDHRKELVDILLLDEDAMNAEKEGRFVEAIRSLERALILRATVYGDSHIEVTSLAERLTVMCNMRALEYLAECALNSVVLRNLISF